MAKRQRIESVAKGIAEQCTMVADLVDTDLLMRELESEGFIGVPSALSNMSNPSKDASRSLAQEYPFPDCPPTVPGIGGGSQSPSLERLLKAVQDDILRLRLETEARGSEISSAAERDLNGSVISGAPTAWPFRMSSEA